MDFRVILHMSCEPFKAHKWFQISCVLKEGHSKGEEFFLTVQILIEAKNKHDAET